VAQHVLPDRVHQVRFSQPHTAVDEKGVIGPRRRLGDCTAGGMRKLIRRADDEGVEGVPGIQAGRAGQRHGRRPGFQRGRFVGAEGNDRHVRLRVGDEMHQELGPLQLAHRFGNDPGVVLGQPVLEQGVGYSDRNRRPVISYKGCRPEPGVKAVPVHLRLDTGEDFVPEVHFTQ